jgi:4a-hydroxytetrahydrobiopterin dehydratase
MSSLTEQKSTRPKAGEQLTETEVKSYASQVPAWQVSAVDEIPQISRTYKFKNFSQALAFTVQVGILAEVEDHHPAITTEWGKVNVTFWTHFVKGLHLNDFICAAKTDQLYD